MHHNLHGYHIFGRMEKILLVLYFLESKYLTIKNLLSHKEEVSTFSFYKRTMQIFRRIPLLTISYIRMGRKMIDVVLNSNILVIVDASTDILCK